MIRAANTNSSSSDDTIATVKSEFFVTYKDPEGNEQKEPAYPMCVQNFTFNDRQREILDRSLGFVLTHEDFSVAHWRMTTAQVGNSDWNCYWLLCRVSEDLKKATGLFCMSIEHVRALYGCVHLAVAADVIPPDERDQTMELLGFFSRFRWHLYSRHRSDEGHNIGYDIVDTLDKPLYVGSLNLERAWLLSSKLRGKMMDEIGEVLEAELEGTTEQIRDNLATAHGGRMPRLSVLATALYNAVSNIQSNSEAWSQRAKDSTDSADLIYLAGEIHDQVFVIDELRAMGCHNSDPALNTLGGRSLYRAVDGIRELIDWDECPALKLRLEQAEKTWAKPSAREDDDEGW